MSTSQPLRSTQGRVPVVQTPDMLHLLEMPPIYMSPKKATALTSSPLPLSDKGRHTPLSRRLTALNIGGFEERTIHVDEFADHLERA